jgi:hypothetical protein
LNSGVAEGVFIYHEEMSYRKILLTRENGVEK